MTPERRRALVVCAACYGAAFLAAWSVVFALRGRHPLVVAGVADAVATVVVFAWSRTVDNSSLYDPYWSVAPLALFAYFALGPWTIAASPLRIGLAGLAVALWGVRLTANCLVRWRDLAHEDFRYVDLRAKHGRLYWLVSFLGIHLFPTVLVYLASVPLFFACFGGAPAGVLDGVALSVALAAVGVEGAADGELRRFLAAPRADGAILATGLWRKSRHPNYFGEILFWWGVFGFGLAAGAPLWTASGALAITLLFVFISVPLMDARMLARRPAYAEHMKRTNALVPF